LHEELGREPNDEDLAAELGVPAARVAELRRMAFHPLSLDAPVGDDDSESFAEIVQDENADTPYEQLEEKAATGMLQELVKSLRPRERIILKERFGLNGDLPKPLEQIGLEFGITRERVRQIQNGALQQLRRMLDGMEKCKQ
jgi:RNA polymerase primary sigma factor